MRRRDDTEKGEKEGSGIFNEHFGNKIGLAIVDQSDFYQRQYFLISKPLCKQDATGFNVEISLRGMYAYIQCDTKTRSIDPGVRS